MASSLESAGALHSLVAEDRDRAETLAIQSVSPASHWRPALLVFLGVAALLWWTIAERLTLVNDEGIYLEGARRIAHGEVPYRDFFVLTGPGTFWLHAAVFRLLGVSLSHGRLVLIFDLACLAAAVFWLTAHLASRRLAGFAVFLFVAFQTANPSVLTVNHRWDSGAFAVAAVTLAFAALDRRRWWLLTGCGVLAASAAWITPTLLAVVAGLALWHLSQPDRRRAFAAYFAGVTLAGLAPALLLAYQGALGAMLHHMWWSQSHYPAVNKVSYGNIIGGYGGVLQGASGMELSIRLVLLAVIAAPAYLPLLAFAGGPLWLWRDGTLTSLHRRRIGFLLAAALSLWVSAYPWFLGQLTSAVVLAHVLGAVLLSRLLGRFRLAATLFLGFLAAVFLWSTVRPAPGAGTLETTAGRVRGASQDVSLVQAVSGHVSPGDSLFVFPHRPILYFLTGARNPTRYSFLQPGMMSEEDEAAALQDLERHPPRWIFYEDFPPEAYLRIWPNSDPKRLRLTELERFIHSRYEVVREYKHGTGSFQIRELGRAEARPRPEGRPTIQ